MKTILLSILLSAAPILTPVVRADDDKPDAPHQEKKKEQGEAMERLRAEKARFHEEMEKRMKAVMEEAAQLEAEGKKDLAEQRRRQAKEEMHAAIEEHQRATQEKMREHAGPGHHPEGPSREAIERKLMHVKEAIAHLREAEMPDAAEHLEQVSHRLRAALEEVPRPDKDAPRREAVREEPRRPEGDIDALRREIEELRRVVRELAGKKDGH